MNRLSAVFLSALAALTLVIGVACTGAATPAAGPAQRPVLDGVGNPLGETSGEEFAPGDGTAGDTNQQTVNGALILHTGSLDLEVTDLRGAVDQATALITGMGGNVASSHEQNNDGEHSASVTFRIPAARWAEAVSGLRNLAQRVVAEDTDAEDVTAQVIDLDARIANLRASEAALQAIMDRAGTIADVLKVQAELTKVRGDIESMTAQRAHLADQAALGTLEVRFNMPVTAASVASQGWDLGRELDNAFAALVRVGQGLASLGIWVLIVFLPVAVPILVIWYIAFRLRRRYLARQAAQSPVPPSV